MRASSPTSALGPPHRAFDITQQVAKNFLLSSEQLRPQDQGDAARAAHRGDYTKEKILEIYLNQIYLGFGNYGIAAAALNYYGKSVHELTLAEVAYLPPSRRHRAM